MPDRFVHLHCHTHYSLLDGACKIPDLVRRVKELGMDSLAITDHGCMFGVVEFFNECKKGGIKPILGMEAYMAPGDRRDRSTPGGTAGEAAFHLLLLCQNIQGYQNLLKLSSTAYREGFYYKPRIDKQILMEFNSGLIATSACLGGEIPSAFMKRDAKTARKIAETYLEIFGPDRFFIEVQKQGVREQDMVNPELAELAKKMGVGLVATNDVHYLNRDDHFAHDVLCCISMGRLITDQNRLKYPTEIYLKSPEEMKTALGDFDQAIENTLRIAGMCDLALDFSKRHAPVYRVPDGVLSESSKTITAKADDERYLRQLCETGLSWRYGDSPIPDEVRQRLEKELKIIAGKNFSSYFLIVWDFCNFARKHGIPVGARGSAVGTMVGYLLGLCDVDPIRYGLLFERFMDPNRDEMPDIDIDMCQNGRPKVIEYVRQKYGHVAQIITFGTLAARAVCKDVGRVLGAPLSLTDRITKLIPGTPGMSLEKAMKQVPDLKSLYDTDEQVRRIIDIGQRLEGLCRNAGMHAAGIVIADQPLENFVPLYKHGDDLLTQFEGPIVDKVGLLKMDFLGLRTLTTLQRSVELVKQTRGIDIDLEKLDLTDKTVLDLFCRGQTKGVFQFESGGMQDLLMKMKPDRLDDLIAANALYRPGPMELIPSYCNRKHGRESVPNVHPIIDSLLAETYGIMVYQEQVMQIFNQLGGIELSAAYRLIKAISKKQTDVIAKYRPDFLRGAQANGISKDKAEEIFELILKFGGYGFNKSHSTRYAIIAFQTAFMKVYHPVEYMAALLTFESGSTEKIVEYIEEARRMTLADGTRGIGVLAPDVNASDRDFTPIYDKPAGNRGKSAKPGVIRFGLTAVKGIGEKAVESIIEQRRKRGPFTSLFDFCDRCDGRLVSRSTVEALVQCGAFASTGAKRSQLLAVMERAWEMGQQAQQDRRVGQLSMFGSAEDSIAFPAASAPMPDIPELPPAELLKYEKDLLGFYLTSHPLAEHQSLQQGYATATTRQALLMREGTEVVLFGLMARIKKTVTKSGRSPGQAMAYVTLEDLEGQIECTIFPDSLADILKRSPDILAAQKIIFIRGKIDRKRELPGVLVNDIVPLELAVGRMTKAIKVIIESPENAMDLITRLKPVMERHKGNCETFIEVPTGPSKRTVIRLHDEFKTRPGDELKSDIELVLNGYGRIEMTGDGRGARPARPLFEESPPAAETPAMHEAPDAGDPTIDPGDV